MSLEQALSQEWDVVVCGDYSSGLMCLLPWVKASLSAIYLLNGWSYRSINLRQIELASPDLVLANSTYSAEHYPEYAPTVVRSWYDMAPGSDYLRTLFDTGLDGTEHHLLFSFRGESGDGVVTLASELRPEAQQQARKLYGFDDTHTGILEDAEVTTLVNRLLSGVP